MAGGQQYPMGRGMFDVAPGAYGAAGYSAMGGRAMQSMQSPMGMAGGLGDLKMPLAGFAINMLQQQMAPKPPMPMIQPVPVFSGHRLGNLLPLYPSYG